MATIDTEQLTRYTTLRAGTFADHGVYTAPVSRDTEYMYPSAVCDDGKQANENLYSSKAEGRGKQQCEQKPAKKIYWQRAFLIASMILNILLINFIIVFVALTGLSAHQQEFSSPSQNSLSNLEKAVENITASLEGMRNSLTQFENNSNWKLRELIHLASNTYKSCEDVLSLEPGSPSGYYSINNQIVYCEMGELCGSEGGWTRLAYLDMSNTTMSCPDGFRLYEENNNNTRACGRPLSGVPSCASIRFPSNGVHYSKVCGRVVGYQYATPDAVSHRKVNGSDINSQYVDGVSITRGNPRQHVWTLMAGNSASCPCSIPGYPRPVESFIGNDYFCESGHPGVSTNYIFFPDDPLWDGEGCGSQEGDCCTAPGLPWFHKTLGSTTTDYLELRVCGDQSTWDEDNPVGFYDIYVK